jgi:hypothetical protein
MGFVKKIFKRTFIGKSKKEAAPVKSSNATISGSSSSIEGDSPVVDEETWLTVKEIERSNKSLAKGKSINKADWKDEDLQKKRIAAVQEFVTRVNSHNLEFAGELVTDDNDWHFLDQKKKLDGELAWKYWVEEMTKVNASFPDFAFQYESIVYKCGTVVLRGFRAGGTHTGAPYTFAHCEPIEAAGKKVLNDEEEALFLFREGEHSIARIIIAPRGEMTGPPGFYTQLGGFPLL